ncbi:SAP domain-containing ribonucleoprotein-like [Asterias amurensis]|uniref:SAP domain-containing ribonucleoprotein-like n=1 Tax=Asterias amurensis TaxID=7602 RepID=UPI003AB15B7A
MADSVDLKKLKIPELKKELTSRGLAVKGNKQELVDRLTQYLEENDEAILDNGTEPSDAILTPEAEEEGDGDLLAAEDEPDLLDDDEEEPAIPTKVNVITPVVLTQPVMSPAKDKPSSPTGVAEKVAVMPPAASAALTPAERKALRAERFNTPLSEAAKKQARLEKFGGKAAAVPTSPTLPKTQAKATPVTAEALDKLKKRSERFGVAVSQVVKQTEEVDRLLKRKQRFGVITNTTATEGGVKRLSTEGSTDDAEAKKKKRAERFGL